MEHQIQTPDQMSSQKILDADDLIDEIIAKKGPHKYTEGLSEDNWEEVSPLHMDIMSGIFLAHMSQGIGTDPIVYEKSP